jgi:hypothetical protein
VELDQGDVVFLSRIAPTMTDDAFEALLVGKSENTTVPYMRKAKAFIIRGLLTRGTERKAVNDRSQIIAGTYNSAGKKIQGRVFLVENDDKATLIWQGDSKHFRANYMRIRDELAGMVRYSLRGKAATKHYSKPTVRKKIEGITDTVRVLEVTTSCSGPQDSADSIESHLSFENQPSWLNKLRACNRCFDLDRAVAYSGPEGSARPLFYEDGNWGSDILFIMEAPNYEDTFNLDLPYQTRRNTPLYWLIID